MIRLSWKLNASPRNRAATAYQLHLEKALWSNGLDVLSQDLDTSVF